MYFNSGYLNNSRLDFKDYSKPLVVGSCGTYRLKKRPKLPTSWAKGRRDYQILYVASGKAHFWFDGVEEVVTSGHMVLYQPTEIQKYVYYVEDHPEVFWIHFTGYDVKNILNYHGIPLDKHVFYSGTLPDYKMLFRKIIRELQQRSLAFLFAIGGCIFSFPVPPGVVYWKRRGKNGKEQSTNEHS